MNIKGESIKGKKGEKDKIMKREGKQERKTKECTKTLCANLLYLERRPQKDAHHAGLKFEKEIKDIYFFSDHGTTSVQ